MITIRIPMIYIYIYIHTRIYIYIYICIYIYINIYIYTCCYAMRFFGFLCTSMYAYVFVGSLKIENRIQPKRPARRECRGTQPTWVCRATIRVHFEPAKFDENSMVQSWLFCTSSEAVTMSRNLTGVFLLLKAVQECSCLPELRPWVFKFAEVLQNQGKWTNDWTSKF